ncbi:hypothetical protein HanIR_Chr01g0007801 [Helianthus annuus]|nr:hypothetical protein HanIR_Chr01g0007801 [Helianthus annuus]
MFNRWSICSIIFEKLGPIATDGLFVQIPVNHIRHAPDRILKSHCINSNDAFTSPDVHQTKLASTLLFNSYLTI